MKLGSGTEAEAISGGDAVLASEGDAVLASEGDKCESFSGDGTGPTFFGGEANMGGDNDEKYEEDLDFSIAEAPLRRVNRIRCLV